MSTVFSSPAYDYIRGRLLSGKYAPGVRISEFAVAKELGVSRSPVREAISHLISEGLLQKLPGYGAYVKIPDRREIEELLVVRELMETYTVAEAARRADKNQIAELRGACDNIHELARQARKSGVTDRILKKLVEADVAFHTQLYELADNRQIIRIMENSQILSAVLCTYEKDFFNLSEIAHIWREHSRILQAIERRDPQQACHWLKLQIRRSRQLHRSGYERLMENPKFRELRELSKISSNVI